MSAVANGTFSRQATRVDDIDGRFDPWLLGCCIVLACMGVVMVGSAAVAGAGMDVGPWYFLSRHVMFLTGGIVLAGLLMRTELKFIEQHSRLLLLACFVLLLAVFLPGIGSAVNGARRWINLGISKFQVVEAVKLCFALQEYERADTSRFPLNIQPIFQSCAGTKAHKDNRFVCGCRDVNRCDDGCCINITPVNQRQGILAELYQLGSGKDPLSYVVNRLLVFHPNPMIVDAETERRS